MGLSPIDRDALQRAIAQYCTSDERRERIYGRLCAGEDWDRVARRCCFNCQCDALGLEPHQSPPIYADGNALREAFGDPGGRRETVELALRMQRAGLSRFEPDPRRALAEAEKRQATR